MASDEIEANGDDNAGEQANSSHDGSIIVDELEIDGDEEHNHP
jgi:hypothetical protein